MVMSTVNLTKTLKKGKIQQVAMSQLNVSSNELIWEQYKENIEDI